jgi:hypothetical protein
MAADSLPAVVPQVLLGRSFGEAGLQLVREELSACCGASRAELARRMCRRLSWRSPGGGLPLMSARVALLRLHRRGLLPLPSPRNGNGNARPIDVRQVDWPAEEPLHGRVDQLPGLALHPVSDEHQSHLYNALVERYHYLGFVTMAGAQIRYLVAWNKGILGALGFGAAAWQVADRDRFIGWDHPRRRAQLHRIVNNSRFLILPWVRCLNLASKVLALSMCRLADDFHQRYGYRPVLVESFVEEGRFQGSSYQAANWLRVGETAGRGKKGQWHEPRLPRKSIWVYPLERRFRQILCGPESAR